MLSEDNKRIARNTAFLYARTFISLIIGIYTARIVWQVLGTDNYGIYNVVGSIVIMFSFLNGALLASSQRFISFELGRKDGERLNKVFCISLTVHFMLAVAVFLLAETIGLWFLNNRLNIPVERLSAANWVYQCSVIAFMVSIVSVPYNACIVAHEHMKAFGYLGILEAVLKLVKTFLLVFVGGDKLIVYSVLVLAVAVIMRMLYQIYCHRHFPECRFHRVSDRHLMRDMFSFAGWSLIGRLGYSFRNQGLDIIINLFFNVTVNAAKGIANQIGSVINGVSLNFLMALNPQITKSYASGDAGRMMRLVFQGCKYSVLLISVIIVPLVVSAENFLSLWLGELAPYTVGFVRLTLCLALVESILAPVSTAIQATGKIRNFQIVVSVLMLMNLPLSWLWLKMDANPYLVMVVCIVMSVIGVMAHLILLHGLVPFSYQKYLTEVILRIIMAVGLSFTMTLVSYRLVEGSFIRLMLWGGMSVGCSAASIFFLALNRDEKTLSLSYLTRKLRRS